MSVRSPSGITGILPGTRLEVVQDMEEVLRVRTGELQFDAKKYQLTNDLDIAAEVSSRDAAQQKQIAAASSQALTAISVIQARYGYGDKSVDVTNQVRDRVQAGQSSIRAGNDLAGDPAFGKVKTLTIQYSIGGGPPITATAREGESILVGQSGEHPETAPQKQEAYKRPVQTPARAWSNPLERGAYGAWRNPLDKAPTGSNPLDRGAYDKTQDKKYTDSSGRTYWIDSRGRRHYDQN